jgi:hypothetical protein
MFCASFQFYFLCIFLVRGDLVSKHEQLLILTGIGVSALVEDLVIDFFSNFRSVRHLYLINMRSSHQSCRM